TDLQLLNLVVAAVDAAGTGTGRIRARLADEQVGFDGMGGLDARPLKDLALAIAGDGGDGGVEVHEAGDVGEAVADGIGAGAAVAEDVVEAEERDGLDGAGAGETADLG